MPTFELETPQGSKFQIDADDMSAAMKAFDHAFGSTAAGGSEAAPEGGSSPLGDVGKSLGIGLAKGAIGLAGLPSDIAGLATAGINKLAGTSFENPMPATSANIQDMIERTYTGRFRQPETTAGQYAQTVGEFAPGLALPGGAGAGLARRAATNVVLPALASETAGQLTAGTAAEPAARLAAGLLGGLGGAKALAPRAAAGPTAEEILAAGSRGYETPAVTDAVFKRNAVEDVSNSAQQALRARRFNDTTAPKTFGILEDLKEPVGPKPSIGLGAAPFNPPVKASIALAGGGPAQHTMEDFQATREMLGKLAGNFNDPIEGAAASQAIKHLDDYLDNIPQAHLAAGDAAALGKALETARADYSAGKTLERVQTAQRNAALQAGSANSGANIQNTTRQKLRSFLTSRKGARGFTDAEQDELANAVIGSPLGNTLRTGANLLGGGGGLGALAAGTAGFIGTGGNPIGLMAPLAGLALRKAGEAVQARNVNKVLDLIKQRSPTYQAYLAKLPPAQRNAELAGRAGIISMLAQTPQGPLGRREPGR